MDYLHKGLDMFNRENLDKVIVALMVGAVSWLFLQSIQVNPMVSSINKLSTSVDKLSITLVDNQKDNTEEHSQLAQMIFGQESIMAEGKARLFAVEKMCDENHKDIKACKETH